MAVILREDSNMHHLMLDASTIQGLGDPLKPFEQVTEMLSASKHLTISMVKPLLHRRHGEMTLSNKETVSKEVSMAKEVIANHLARTYQETPEVDMFSRATLLGPCATRSCPFCPPWRSSRWKIWR